MGITVVRIIKDSDGENAKNNYWHFTIRVTNCTEVLCTSEVFGASSSPTIYESSDIEKLNCPECIARIKYFKSINLTKIASNKGKGTLRKKKS